MTAAQSAEIASAGYEIYEDSIVDVLATKNMTSDEEVAEVVTYMQLLRDRLSVKRFYGVFPPAIRSALLARTGKFEEIELWESWNIQRPPDGGKTTFEHKKFVLTFRG